MVSQESSINEQLSYYNQKNEQIEKITPKVKVKSFF